MSHKVVLVTGASSGIGEAIALKLLDLGYTVYGAARRVDRMAALANRGVHVLSLDLTDDTSVKAAADQILSTEGRIDVLVNNAGYGSYGAIEDVPPDEARTQFEVNLFGAARLIQLFLPQMRAQHSGTIINITSMGGRLHTPLGGWYHATKFALEGLSDSLRLETARFGINVVVIEPGNIRTEWSGVASDHLQQTSAGGAYADLAKLVAASLKQDPNSSRISSSPPSVIANAVAKAVTARRPKTRYAVGSAAKPLIFLRRLLPDRSFDFVIRQAVRLAA